MASFPNHIVSAFFISITLLSSLQIIHARDSHFFSTNEEIKGVYVLENENGVYDHQSDQLSPSTTHTHKLIPNNKYLPNNYHYKEAYVTVPEDNTYSHYYRGEKDATYDTNDKGRPSGDNDHDQLHDLSEPRLMDHGYVTTSTTTNPTNTNNYPYKNGGKSYYYNNQEQNYPPNYNHYNGKRVQQHDNTGHVNELSNYNNNRFKLSEEHRNENEDDYHENEHDYHYEEPDDPRP
ncbi:uncharacterized protein LOC132063693 [Lycium ferocissimum]|uniref:uncharacterized protein LOC132063693 n=1 Tax=Lycium ferocissimum TaxID=112874 RepID=UPI00281555F3|nr:uncharacterized protein LOC132063693 [Lycium ferocissimum]